MKIGDLVRAKPGSTSAIWAEGRLGRIMELRDPKPYSGNDSNNLVHWGDVLMGFDPEDVEVVEKPNPEAVEHYPSCRSDYPEKVEGEKPRALQEMELEDGYSALVCVDCGAKVDNLPPLEDPYWDDVRGGLL